MMGATASEKAISTAWGAGRIAPPDSITAARERQHASIVVSLSSAGAQWSDDVDAVINDMEHSQMAADNSPSETIAVNKMEFCMVSLPNTTMDFLVFANSIFKGSGRIGLH